MKLVFRGYTYKPRFHIIFQSNISFIRNYGSSTYQTPPTKTSKSRMEFLLDQILEGQQEMRVKFNGKMDSICANVNGKFETLNTHVKKLDTQVAQTDESVKRQKGFASGKEIYQAKTLCQCHYDRRWRTRDCYK